MNGLVGGPLLVGGLGTEPPAPLYPVLISIIEEVETYLTELLPSSRGGLARHTLMTSCGHLVTSHTYNNNVTE